MSRFVRWLGVFALLAFFMQGIPSAHADEDPDPSIKPADGCPVGDIVMKRQRWTKNTSIPGTFGGTATYLVEAFARYEYCPNGTRANKMQVVRTSTCVTHTDTTFAGYFAGGYGSSAISDAYWPLESTHTRPEFTVPDSFGQGDRVCSPGVLIPEVYQKWQYMRDDPRWKHLTHFYLNGETDKDVIFTNGELQVKFFTPSEDETI